MMQIRKTRPEGNSSLPLFFVLPYEIPQTVLEYGENMQITDTIHAFLWESISQNNCNTYLINGKSKILIDPGHLALFSHVEEALGALSLTPGDIDLVIATHAHPDHIEAFQKFHRKKTLFAIGREEWRMVLEMQEYISTFGIDISDLVPDFFLCEGELTVKDNQLIVLDTPGHSPGGISIYLPKDKALFTGDTIFKEGIGRTDLPGGDINALQESIEKLASPDLEWVLPGHGPVLSGIHDIQTNFMALSAIFQGYPGGQI